MGRSTNGILFYGLCYWDESRLPWVAEDDYEGMEDKEHFLDKLCRLLGGPTPPVREGLAEVYGKALLAYWASRDAFLLEKLGGEIELVFHCHSDNPMYGLAIKSTVTTAHRGSPERIRGTYDPGPEVKVLRVACAALGMDFETEEQNDHLGWWLVSDTG